MKDTQLRCSRSSLCVDHARRRSGCAEARDEEVAFRAAMETETVKGDLKGAIERIERLLMAETARLRRRYSSGWRIAIKARRRAGSAVFEQVVRDYADQKDAVAIARTRRQLSPNSRRRLRVQRGDSSSTGRPAVHMRCPRSSRSLVRYNTDQRTFSWSKSAADRCAPC